MNSILLFALILAQATSTAPVSGHDKGRMEHESRANNDAVSQGAAARAQTTHRNERVWTDATRLAALLRDVQVEVNLTPASWRTIANEANVLANRIYARTSGSGRTAARDLRTHVREMRRAALRGDASGARRHATEALPFAYRVIDWAD